MFNLEGYGGFPPEYEPETPIFQYDIDDPRIKLDPLWQEIFEEVMMELFPGFCFKIQLDTQDKTVVSGNKICFYFSVPKTKLLLENNRCTFAQIMDKQLQAVIQSFAFKQFVLFYLVETVNFFRNDTGNPYIKLNFWDAICNLEKPIFTDNFKNY